MIPKNKIWYRQVTAAFFMLVLFAVTITQVLHRHTADLNFSGKTLVVKTGDQCVEKEASTSTGNCFICDYQLAKDADASYFLLQEISNSSFYNYSSFSYTFIPTGISTFFETRGPPHIT